MHSSHAILILQNPNITQIPPQTFLAFSMLHTTFMNHRNRITQKQLIESSRKQCGGDVDQDTDPAVRFVGEGFATVEDGSYESGTEVSSHIGGDGYIGETPDHDTVAYADDDGDGGGGDEGVGWVDAGPNYEGLYLSVLIQMRWGHAV